MQNIIASQIIAFLKRFRFTGGSLRAVRLANDAAVIIVRVLDTESNRRVRLKLRIDGVEEFRFQRRPITGSRRLRDVRIGCFNGVMYLNLDAYPDEASPALHDFRASEAFVGGRSLAWEIVERTTSKE